MKMIATLTFIVGLAIMGFSALAQIQAKAGSTHIISDISSLRLADHYEECEALCARTSRTLRRIQDSLTPLLSLGAITAMLGLAALIMALRKQPKECGQQSGPECPPQGVGSAGP